MSKNTIKALQPIKQPIITLAASLTSHENYQDLKTDVEARFYDFMAGNKPGTDWELKQVVPGMHVLFLDPDEHVSSGIYTVASVPERGDDEPLDDEDTIGLSSDTSSLEAFKSELYVGPVEDIDYLYAAMFAQKLEILSVTGFDKPTTTVREMGLLVSYFTAVIKVQAFDRKFSFKISVVEGGEERALQSIHNDSDGELLIHDEDELLLTSLLHSVNRLRENMDNPDINLSQSQIDHLVAALC